MWPVMTAELYPEFFNDVFGPIMQPGSSSHTAAPCRLGYLAHCALGEMPTQIRVVLDRDGSFAGTFGLMHEDNAMLAGAMGILPDDARLFDAAEMAWSAGIEYSFEFTEMQESTHINAVKFVLTGQRGRMVSLVGDSTGGGMVETKLVNGYPLRVKGDSYVVLVFDPQESLASHQIEQVAVGLAGYLAVGASRREGEGGILYFVKAAEEPPLDAILAMFPEAQIE